MVAAVPSSNERQYLATRLSVKKQERVAEDGLDVSIDSLTGFMTEKGFLDTGRYLLAVSLQLGLGIKALHIDVQGFEQYTERNGAAAGDRALIEIAQALTASFRECDLISRISESEFCVLLSAGPESHLESRLQRLEEHLQRAHEKRMPELRFSIGMATVTFCPEEHESLQKLIADARKRS
jgi:diguanylate cyclase (GGDEF)-like protein